MKKNFFILAFIFLASPFLVIADSYDGPYCFENPVKDSRRSNDPQNIRGTCKPVEITSIVALDIALQNDYLLAQHKPIDLSCFRTCDTSKNSEVIQTTKTVLTFTNEDVIRESTSENILTGEKYTYHPDTAILLGKKYVLDFITSVYGQTGIKFDDNRFPQIVLIDQNEMKSIRNDQESNVGYSYEDILSLFKGKNDPVYINGGKDPLGTTTTPSIYTFNYSDFGKHIYSIKGSLAEANYLEFDKTKLPPVEVKFQGADHGGGMYVVPITSPVKSVKNYWIFIKKNGKIVLMWQRSEYGLDNGKVDVVSNDTIKINKTVTSGKSTNIASSSATSTPVVILDQKKGFFSKMFGLIRSWFK